jgi:hypothetical protein
MVSVISDVVGPKASEVSSPRQPAARTPAFEPNIEVETKDAVQQPISPRIREDAAAGTIVTEFVGSNGQVSQQVPSAAALAYLRAGLTAQGVPVETPADTAAVTDPRKTV